MREWAIAIVLAFAIPVAPAHGASSDEVKPVKVFILAGQSNMEGKAPNSLLDYQAEDPKTKDLFKHLRNGGKWIVRDDVFIKYLDRKGPLTIGYGSPGRTGVELEFGTMMGDHFAGPVLLIKAAWGGHSLVEQFRSPSAGYPADAVLQKQLAEAQARVKKNNEKQKKNDPLPTMDEIKNGYGSSYRKMLAEVRETFANRETMFPALKGKKLELAGFVWFQGWNDQYGGAEKEYASNMEHFIKDVRKDLDVPNLPFVIAAMGQNGTKPAAGAMLTIREAQMSMSDVPEFRGNVKAFRTDVLVDKAAEELYPTWSQNLEQWKKTGGDHGYHYLGSAIWFTRIGHAMGEAMLELIPNAAAASAAEGPTPAPVDGPPAAWLSPAGKSEAWKSTTGRCRDLLAKLKLEDALVKKHLPRLTEKVQLLARSPDFDWKQKTAVEYVENLLEDILAGKEPCVRYRGQEFAYPYWSNTMQRIEAIWIHVPPAYDPAKRYQFFLYYKCGGGIHLKGGRVAGGYRPTLEAANRTDSFHAWSSLDIQVKGRKGAHIEVEEATAALCRDFSIDPDRIFLSGWSDGGFTAIWLASHYPHLVAGIAPLCGNWQYSNIENVGLCGVPTLAVDGWGDGGYNAGQFCRWLALRGLGANARCIWGHHGHSYQPYEDPEEFHYLMDWAKGKKRDLYPKRIRCAAWNLSWNRAYWLAIDRVENPALAAQFEAEVTGANRIEVQARNIAAYRLTLSDKLVDPQRPITVVTNGKPSYSGPFKAELLIDISPRPAAKFVKDAALPDDIAAAIIESTYATKGSSTIPSRRWLAVRPTGWDEKTAGLLAKWPPKDAKADVDVSDDDLAACNLLVYGGPNVNKLAARLAADLPVKFAPGKFIVGSKAYDRPSHCVALVHPNPLNPKRYVIVYAFNDAQTFARHGFFGMTGGGLSEFRTGDCLISGIPAERRRWGAAMSGGAFQSRHLIFDAAWKVDSAPPLGEFDRPLDYLQFLRLKADAVREATGADVGVIWEHTPSWNRWGESLPAGPVTFNDLAAIDMFPENITVAEMSGAELLHGRPAASTVVADRRDPSYDGKTHLSAADIGPAKTYRVAMGYFGMPSYGADTQHMPKLFPFATVDEFLAVKSNRVPLKNFRQLPAQVIEATGQYIHKRKRVSPRPVAFDLTEYVINPQDNDYGACDWLHVGVDAPGQGGAARPPGRYTLNLGLRRADGPESAPPRGNSKQFLDLAAMGAGPAAFDLAGLDKKLPVSVKITTTQHAITADKDFKTFTWAPADVKENRLGHTVLAVVELANAGPQDIAVTAVLSASELRQVWRQTWPDEEEKDPRGFYAGYHQARGEPRQPPVHEDAALLLFSEAVPKATRLVASNAGYNLGLAGLHVPLIVKAGRTLHVPLLLVSLDKPPECKAGLAEVLGALKADLLGRK